MVNVVRPVQGLVVEDVGEEICLFRPDVDEVLVLNATAADTWRLLDGVCGVEEVAACLATAYAADLTTVLRDVRAVVGDLQVRGFVVDNTPQP